MTFQLWDFAVVLVAAGRGERAGREAGPKQYRPIAGVPVLRHTLSALGRQMPEAHYVVAIHPDDRPLYEEAIRGLPYDVEAVEGGRTRQASTRLALEALRERDPAAVMIHDGVRPFIDRTLLERVASAVRPGVAVLPALAVPDTLKRANAEGLVQGTVSREGLFTAQTPQAFAYPDIYEAHKKASGEAREDFTDDAAIAEWAGLEVRIVEGEAANTKITWPRDLEQAEMRMKASGPAFPDVRTGNGYDVHSFEDGDRVTLCGVSIPHDRKLSGHSDADVGLHALTDALLATCGEGDIGTHFPPSDPKWKGAASRIFVEHAAKLVREAGGRIANADVTLICEAPRVGPHRQAMCEAMAAMLGISADRVSMKATTNEKLGFVGRREGIAAIATATVVFAGEVPA